MAEYVFGEGVVLTLVVPQSPAVVAVMPDPVVLHVVPAFGPKGDDGEGGGGQVSSVNGRIGDVVGLAEASAIPDVSGFATGGDLEEVRSEIPDVSGLATKLELDGVESQIPDVSGFATAVALGEVQAQIPDVSGLATDADLDAVAASIPSTAGLASSAEVASSIATASGGDRARQNHTGTQTASTISDFDASVMARVSDILGIPLGAATLDANGKLHADQVPAIALVDTYVRSSEAQMLALGSAGAEQGDVCVRTDLNESFILKSGSASTLSNWQVLLHPASPVTSVNGRVGPVSGLAEQSYVDLVAAALTAHTSNLGNPHQTTTSQINEDTPYKRFTNEGDVTRLANTSGTNTGDQDLSSYVRGPGVATDNAIVRFDLTTGKLIQSSAVTITDAGEIRMGALNAPGGSTGAAIAIPAGKASRGIVLQQTSAAGTLNMLEGQRSDGGTTWRFDSAGSLRFQGNTDQSVVVTTDGSTKSSSNAKTQFQASNSGSNALAIFGFGTQTADFIRYLTDAGTVVHAVAADGKLLWGPNNGQDVNLYRSAANVLATDDSFTAAGTVTGSNLSGTNTGDQPSPFVDARTNIGVARPALPGPVMFAVTAGAVPTNFDATKGDVTVSST